jgi:hypothetical protein
MVALAMLAVPAAASASISSVFTGKTVSGNGIPCTAQTDGIRVCHGTFGTGTDPDLRVKSFDSAPLEVYVILPPAPSSGTDGHYPLIVQSHGWGGSAAGPASFAYSGPTADAWAREGYAVVQLTARGFNASCGSGASRLAAPLACQDVYIHLDDERYEVRDIQYVAGLLVDAGLASPTQIGATGPSYGGGVSLELATLHNRVMNPDGSLSPWKSPNGIPMDLAASAPVIPWSDLVYALTPNGRTLDDATTTAAADLSPIGVEKQSYNAGLFALGQSTGTYSAVDPQANVPAWFAAINAGEPYDSNPADVSIEQTIAKYHSAFYVLRGAFGFASAQPAALFIANGFTDDLFSVDEAVRYYNLERSLYPNNPIALFDWDGGHPRGQNKAADTALLSARIEAFFGHYVKGGAPKPPLGATALTQTCPKTAPSGGPYTASTWAGLHPGEVDFGSAHGQVITSTAGNPAIGTTIDPIAGGDACATVAATDQGDGVATYRLPAATGSGYTLLGSPTVTAGLQASGSFPQIAERLWDVNPATNTETLVARGVYRVGTTAQNGTTVTFQLHPGAWHFAAGHIPKLELLAQDAPYLRPSNGAFSIIVSRLQLQLPVHEKPGAMPVILKPVKPGTSPSCTARPSSRIIRLRGLRHGLSATGAAAETPCRFADANSRVAQHVAHVFVVVYRTASHHRCRFVRANGHLTTARSCATPIGLPARGATHWSFTLRRLAAGRYLLRTDAVDGLRHHQRTGKAHTVLVRK